MICSWLSLKSYLLIVESGPMCKQDICVSRVCSMRAKATYVTLTVFNCKKTLAWFRCGNMQFEVVLSVWKGVPNIERFCQGCNLGKVENEKHLLLVYPHTQKLGNTFVRPCPSPIRALLLSSCRLQTWSLGQVCGMLPIPKDNLSSMIYLSSNGLSRPKWT
jgi:hypothetical protein